ncbi:MAG: OsmC family protein [Akkermansiaceae bacterium]
MENTVKTIVPIDLDGLKALAAKGAENPTAVRTLKCKTVQTDKFRHENYCRDLDAHIIDEPPGLLGDDTAPNPSEAVLAALGSCIAVGIHANCVMQGIDLYKLEVELEGDINISAVWGCGDLGTDKVVGFSDIRVKAHVEGDAPKEKLDEIVQHANIWSPVANTMRLPVNMTVESA